VDLDRLYEQIGREHGRLDVLFANAGFDEFATLGQITEEHFDRLFDTNVKGLLFTVQKSLPLLRDGAAVILNASVVSIKGFEGMGVYNATKAAVRSFARTWTAELKGRNIRVNVVSPGPIDTPGLDLLVGPGNAEGFKAAMAAAVPLGRVGSADEIAKAVTFLASADASYVAGVELFVDGGMAQV
jgi:NAD(P)-dependent dehydrogenase (short-subunit alcohol dehydrogenase family)